MNPAEVEVLADPAALAARAADWLLAAIAARPGRIAVALSGGGTPRPAYRLLAQAPRRTQLPWERVHWFWGDERCVPPDDPESNYRMVREAMLGEVPAPAANIHPVPVAGVSPAAAAAAYEREMREFYGAVRLDPVRPLFAATLLGIGADGHTASLFPGSRALGETARWAVAVTGAASVPRVSLTLQALNSSAALGFLAAGEEKRGALARIFAGDTGLPAARVRPAGPRCFLIDRAAAPPETLARMDRD